MIDKKEEDKIKEDKWGIKELVKEIRLASYRSRELLTSLLNKKLTQDPNSKKTTCSVNNIENGRALVDNGLYNAILGTFLYIDVEHEIDIVKKAKELADALIAENAQLEIKKILSYNHINQICDYIESHTKKLRESYIKELLENFSSEISIQLRKNKKIEFNNSEQRFIMNDSAKFIFYLAYCYLLGTYKYDSNKPKYGREETREQYFSEVAEEFGYKDWNDKEGQSRTKALKNINIQIGLSHHIFENPSVMEYLEECGKIYESDEQKILHQLENDERTKEINDIITAINKETPTLEDITKIYNYLINVDNILLETFNYYQGQIIPGPTIWENFKKYIIEIENIANDKDYSENDRNDFATTATKIRRHYKELELYYYDNQNKLFEVFDSLNYKTKHLSHLIKSAQLELISLYETNHINTNIS